jgi:hypothetical protein
MKRRKKYNKNALGKMPLAKFKKKNRQKPKTKVSVDFCSGF